VSGGGGAGRRGDALGADGGDGGGGAGNGFDRRSAVSGAADRVCAMDGGKGGTGGGGSGGSGGASALFDGDGRVGPKVIDRVLRSVSDSLRRREPAEEGGATDGAGVWDDGLAGDGNAKFGCEGGTA